MSEEMTVIRPKKSIPRWEPIVREEWKKINFALGNGTQLKITYLMIPTKNSIPKLFIGIVKVDSYVFSTQAYTNPDYVARNLNLLRGDAAIIADWINFQISKCTSRPLHGEYGTYEEQYLND